MRDGRRFCEALHRAASLKPVENPYPRDIMVSLVEKEVDSVVEVGRQRAKPLVVVFPLPALAGGNGALEMEVPG